MPVYIPPGRGAGTGGSVPTSSDYVSLIGDQTVSGEKTWLNDQFFSSNVDINGDLTTQNVTVSGNLNVSGAILNNLEIEDNIVLLNRGETAAGVTAGYSGIQVDRGLSTDSKLLFKENTLAVDNDNRWVIDIGDGTEEQILYDNIPDDVTLNGKLTVNNDLDVNFDLTVVSLAGNTGEIVSLDSNGKILASGVASSTISGGPFVKIGGDTMTGPLIVNYDGTALQVNGDGDATIRINNPAGGDNYSLLSYAINDDDRFGIYCDGDVETSTNKFALYDYYEGIDFLNYVDGRLTLNTIQEQASLRLVNLYYDDEIEISFAYDEDYDTVTDAIDKYSLKYHYSNDTFGFFKYTGLTSGDWVVKCDGLLNQVEISNPIVAASLEAISGTSDGLVYVNSDGKLLRYEIKPEDIATTQDVYNLDVDLQGQILNVMNPAEVSAISGSSVTIDSFPHYNEFGTCEWIININNGTDTRASRVLCVYKPSTTTINSTEDTVDGIGDTSDATITVTIDSTNVYLKLTSTATWNFKTKRITV
jgi:hypothetical protein